MARLVVGSGRGRLLSWRAGCCGCFDLIQESIQVADLAVRHGWSYGKGGDGQPTSGYGQCQMQEFNATALTMTLRSIR